MHVVLQVLLSVHLTYIFLELFSNHEAKHVQNSLTLFVSKNVLTCVFAKRTLGISLWTVSRDFR